jgi:hypothetical protein
MGHKQFGKCWLVMEDPNHFGFFHPQYSALRHGPGRREALRLRVQASFPEKLVLAKDSDDGLLPFLGSNHNLDLAFFDVKNCVRGLCLRVDNFILAVFGNGPATRGVVRNTFASNAAFFAILTMTDPFRNTAR